jgi:hypothetical protein
MVLFAERVWAISGWLPTDLAPCGRQPRRSGAALNAAGSSPAGMPWH